MSGEKRESGRKSRYGARNRSSDVEPLTEGYYAESTSNVFYRQCLKYSDLRVFLQTRLEGLENSP